MIDIVLDSDLKIACNIIRLKYDDYNDFQVVFSIDFFTYRFTRDDVETGFTHQDMTFIDLYNLCFKIIN